MSNGVAVHLPLEPTVAPSNGVPVESRRKPVAAPAPADVGATEGHWEINRKIGAMVADAVAALAAGAVDWAEAGAMTPATRTLNGEMLGRIVMLRLDNLGPNQLDFDAVALDEGRKVLLARLGAIPHEALVIEMLHHVVDLTKMVFAAELVFQARN